MSTRFDDWSSDELAHFGTKGMRWGQRRYQNEDGSLTAAGRIRYGQEGHRSARGRSRDLNKLDREYTQASAKAKRLMENAEHRYTRQNYRYKKHNPGSGNLAKDEKVKKWEAKAKEYQKLASKSKSLSDRIIKNSLKKGMSVRSKDTLRQVEIGRNLAKSIGISMLIPGVYTRSSFAKGTHYRVRNDGNAQRIHKKNKRVSRNVGTQRMFVYG